MAHSGSADARRSGQFVGVIFVFIVLLVIAAVIGHLTLPGLAPVWHFLGAHPILNALVKAVVYVSFIALLVLFLIWWERKFAGWLQARLGPKHVGPQGMLQTLADALKLITKEDITPAVADRPLFYLAPFVVFVPTVLTFMVLPLGPHWIAQDLNVALLYVIAISSMTATGIMAAGWGSNNKYSLLGGVRAVAKLLSYEVPMVMAVLSVVTFVGGLSMRHIIDYQAQNGWLILKWPLIPAFLIFLIAALAELNRTPFDLPEAESELVSGFHTEYSGMRFAFFFLAEFANNFFSAGFAVALFFGGYLGPILPGIVWFILKTFVLITLMMWIRWTVPRLRIDQMMGLCWKLLVPLSLVVFILAAAWASR